MKHPILSLSQHKYIIKDIHNIGYTLKKETTFNRLKSTDVHEVDSTSTCSKISMHSGYVYAHARYSQQMEYEEYSVVQFDYGGKYTAGMRTTTARAGT